MINLYDVLKPEGRLVICYANKEFLGNLTFPLHYYRLYDAKELERHLSKASFKHLITKGYKDKLVEKHGELIDRTYTVIVCQKSI